MCFLETSLGTRIVYYELQHHKGASALDIDLKNNNNFHKFSSYTNLVLVLYWKCLTNLDEILLQWMLYCFNTTI